MQHCRRDCGCGQQGLLGHPLAGSCLLAMYSRQVKAAPAASTGDPTAAKNLGRLGIFQLDEDAPSEQVCRLVNCMETSDIVPMCVPGLGLLPAF